MATHRNQAHEFFEMHVVPAMNEWLSKPDDLRLTGIAAGALNDMAEHFWHGFEKIEPARVFNTPNVKAFRPDFAKKYNDWSLVRDVAETHKHVKTQSEGPERNQRRANSCHTNWFRHLNTWRWSLRRFPVGGRESG
ncbi:MAG: hypothetical protein ACXW1Q_06460 [Halobacteriota archaeon]